MIVTFVASFQGGSGGKPRFIETSNLASPTFDLLSPTSRHCLLLMPNVLACSASAVGVATQSTQL